MGLRIRCGSGLGDSLYLQAVARHLAKQEGKELDVCSNYPILFKNLPVNVVPFSRENIDITSVYTTRKIFPTSQFEDCCITAGLNPEHVEYTIDWPKKQVIDVFNPLICVQMPRTPMGRDDGFADELLPDCRVIQTILDSLEGFKALLGAGDSLFDFSGIDLDLTNRTSIQELLDISSSASGFVGYPSFFIPLAESFNKPALFVFSRRGRLSKNRFIRLLTPKKLLHKNNCFYVYDDDPEEKIRETTENFYRLVLSEKPV